MVSSLQWTNNLRQLSKEPLTDPEGERPPSADSRGSGIRLHYVLLRYQHRYLSHNDYKQLLRMHLLSDKQ